MPAAVVIPCRKVAVVAVRPDFAMRPNRINCRIWLLGMCCVKYILYICIWVSVKYVDLYD